MTQSQYTIYMTTTFILIRHGETKWNEEGRMMGITDIPLTTAGKKQAAAVARHLRSFPFNIIFSSPLKRTIQTSHAIHRFHPKIPLLIDVNLRERDFGNLEGLTYEEINQRHPELIYSDTWKYSHFRPKGGESLADLKKRADTFLLSIFPVYKGKKIAVVSHGTFLRVLICRILAIPLTDFSQLHMDNTALTILEHSPDRGGSIHVANYTAHLPDLTKNV